MRIAGRDLDAGFRVQKDAVVGDREDAGQLVGNHDDRCAKIRAQLEDQIVEQARANRIESGRRLVEEQDVRIERHRTRQPRALLHPPLIWLG